LDGLGDLLELLCHYTCLDLPQGKSQESRITSCVDFVAVAVEATQGMPGNLCFLNHPTFHILF